MNKIDTSNWKEFRVGELFNIFLSKDDLKPNELEVGDTPLISSGQANNGIIAYIVSDTAKLWSKNTLTVDMFGKCFYQKQDYYCVSHGRVNILQLKEQKSERVMKFLAAVIEKQTDSFNYTEMCTSNKLKNIVINLPVSDEKEPDYRYMEDFMKSMEEKVKNTLDKFSLKNTSEKIDTSRWEKYHLYDLFEVSMGNKFDRSKMNELADDVNFVGRSGINNGVACSVGFVKDKNDDIVEPYKAGDITIAMGGSIGSSFIQEKDFYTSQNVCVLHTDNPEITYHVKQFIVASISISCNNYEAFVDELNRHIKTDFVLYLPTKEDKPDWKYMEGYMKALETNVINTLNDLVI